MTRVTWKKGTVISIEAREDICFLAQMMEEPFLYFFDIYNDSHEWKISSLENTNTLFCVPVVHKFLKDSHVKKMDIVGNSTLQFPSRWIQRNFESQMYTIWEGTDDEMTFAMSKPGGVLVERTLTTKPQDFIVIKEINNNEDSIIDSHELTSLRTYPELNERLYLSYLFGKNVDPLKDIMFQRTMKKEYKVYMQIFTGKYKGLYK
ncbi:hypothetical protein RP300_01306 [Oligella urethralis]|uniref:hypothetical protein n=1 Tax=Pseudomonadati TaxID=3379134 RepID=UPI00036319EF|nr:MULTISPECIES: hypothetical protein [Bacteria]MDK7374229.1 hypothetical protein [Weeksella virosa]OFM86090.1 hypothetical protein HMPREF2660_06115 [Weeksella sp. HMSC059D05]WOS37753.1 hypothetical protein RP300_01306 [Oligella urethralis]SUA66267.1 Uncharacterised protein [Oligella urethralis]SUP54231.1 Uncharacterised protein [Weeksella virosa]